MTRQEERIKIAELDGYSNIITYNKESGKQPTFEGHIIPNYHVDYNAIRNVIIKLDDLRKYDYMHHLKRTTGVKNFFDLLYVSTEQMATALANI